jgi:exonuclease V
LDAPASTSRAPIERFRPRGRPLSVTDLVSPAWCEMQWAFVLARHGRKRMNAAMASGTRVHQRLEAEVHRTVQVETTSREDSFGLRIWNVIQGLQTLRDTGMTRELEVWGVFKGQLINGCIDELSYVCPDTDQEAEAEAEAGGRIRVAADQTQLTDFYGADSQTSTSTRDTESYRPTPTSSQETPSSQEMPSSQGSADGGQSLRHLRSFRMKTSRIYICDVKTRAAASIPRGAAFRPTYLQLMLYRHLLGQMVRGTVSIVALCRALRLDVDANFSDRFIAQIGAMDEKFYEAASEAASDAADEVASGASSKSNNSPGPSGTPGSNAETRDDAIDLLLTHNSLRSLWALLRSEYMLTFPSGEASLGNLLKAEYRNPDDGAIRGMTTFVYERDLITEYVTSVLQWWHGEREPVGVVEQEAYKCRNCDFREDCGWRSEREGEARERFREKMGERRRSRV